MGQFNDKVINERLRWFGHVQKRNMGYNYEKSVAWEMELPSWYEKESEAEEEEEEEEVYGCYEGGYGNSCKEIDI